MLKLPFVLTVLMANQIYAQISSIQKIGHADWEYIFSQLPEFKAIEKELKSYETQLQNQAKSKVEELNAKYKIYQELPESTPETIRRDKESELSYLQENIQRFQQDAQASIQKKENELVTPVFARVGKAIEEVAKENGFTYILNPRMLDGGDVLLFTDEQYNISELVLKKLRSDATKAPTKQN
jgi:outer membrane protein